MGTLYLFKEDELNQDFHVYRVNLSIISGQQLVTWKLISICVHVCGEMKESEEEEEMRSSNKIYEEN